MRFVVHLHHTFDHASDALGIANCPPAAAVGPGDSRQCHPNLHNGSSTILQKNGLCAEAPVVIVGALKKVEKEKETEEITNLTRCGQGPVTVAAAARVARFMDFKNYK